MLLYTGGLKGVGAVGVPMIEKVPMKMAKMRASVLLDALHMAQIYWVTSRVTLHTINE